MTNKSDRYHAFRCLTSDGKFECAYCGCDVWSELEIDHVNGNGKQHREECGLGRYYTIYDWINEGYRITSGETQHPIVTDYIVKNGVAYTRSRWVRTEYILQNTVQTMQHTQRGDAGCRLPHAVPRTHRQTCQFMVQCHIQHT